ncbi:hypothetical protein BDP27DRAFT_1430073 [Rhodocollybia butyracea]|uniref:Uncharacterized protein n=1 Tax=Rhodocollybia butyracea TaxID=206335 RepID=A0A9P5PC51_9AGAR|nr:hypothetical protein BDP27DRAFT_1430073 [Rhodocollybia butyracea]
MSSNWTQNREFIAALNKNFAQLPQSFADFWTSTGGSINEGGYVSALGDVLEVQFQDLVTQLSTGNASNASEQRTTPQSAYSTPFDFQLEQFQNCLAQPTVALSLCDLHPEQLQSSHPPPGPRRLLSLPPIQTIQTKLPPTSPIQPLPKSPLTATPPPIPQSLSHSKPRSTAPSNPSPCSTPSTPTMTRTRGMDKLSAVKNAKTRGGKARVLNAVAKKRLVMDSATIAVPVEPRAPKRTLPAPESVEPARPPTPIRMDEKGPATAVEYTGTEQSAVLKAGWSIIRRYFFDEVGADAVLNYLIFDMGLTLSVLFRVLT